MNSPHPSNTNSGLYTCSPYFHCQISVEYPPPDHASNTHSYFCTSLLYTCTPHFHHIIRVESWPHTTPRPTQCSIHYRHCGHQSFGLLFLPSPCQSAISCYIPALNLSYNGFRVVLSPPVHPTFRLNNVPYYYSIHFYLITECPPSVCPP
ncbi:hypothetical protein T05_1621 [Trichinella murrelli]|uniref:Uncharacterized protein n=1 Tax=Trichinella murrelli TaxID=144512 RepID=A0A0V0T5I4_9BILA|nr:hypothetical protein T05_1621 [Trichinella murrelli]